MKRLRILTGVVVIGLTVALPCAVSAAEKQEGQTVDHPSKAQKEVPPTPAATQPGTPAQGEGKLSNNKSAAPLTLLYKPPLGLGAPTGLIAGGSRGTSACLAGDSGDRNTTLTLSVLAPADHTGLTVHEQPSLYWYLSTTTNCRIEVTLTDEQAVEPLLELTLSPPIKPGVQHIQLADHGVHLAPGVQYQWAVALIPDPEHRSKDIVAAGGIKRIGVPEALQAKLTQADEMEATALYAEAGLWYDAVAAISDLITAAPSDSLLRTQRATLLEQIRLPEVADYDRKLSYQQKTLGQRE